MFGNIEVVVGSSSVVGRKVKVNSVVPSRFVGKGKCWFGNNKVKVV